MNIIYFKQNQPGGPGAGGMPAGEGKISSMPAVNMGAGAETCVQPRAA